MSKDIKDQFIETIPVERQAFFWVGLYYYLARAAFRLPGGEAVIREATRSYGKERARRRRHIILSKGLKPNLVSLFQNGDLNGDERFISDPKQSSLTEELRRHIVLRCPDAEMWKELGDEETHIGRTYCEEVHHTLYGGFDDAVQVNLCETITHGDPVCRFYIYCRKSNQHPQNDLPYTPQSWEDTGTDGMKCNFTMFSLFYCHLASHISKKLGMAPLRQGILDFAGQRGRRLRELDRRNGRPTGVLSLLDYGDLFLDPRFKIFRETIPNGVRIHVRRCVFAEVQNCHGTSDLGAFYCSLLYRELVRCYDPRISVRVAACLCCREDHECLLEFTEGTDSHEKN